MPNDSRVQVLATPSQLSQGFSSKSNWCEGSTLWRGSFDPKEKNRKRIRRVYLQADYWRPGRDCVRKIFHVTGEVYNNNNSSLSFLSDVVQFQHSLSKCAQSGLFCVNSAHCINTPLNNAIEKDNLVLSTQLIILNYPVILSHRRNTTVILETYPL